MNEAIRVLLVDDHTLLREGLAAILDQTTDLQLVGSLATGEDAINQVETLNPDVILMDIMMPGINGIEAARWIKERRTDVKILLLSMEINKDLISAGIQSGIDGYLPKEVDNRILIEAIRAVHRGEKYFYESVKRIVFEDFYEGEQKGVKVPVNKSEGAKLTSRETEILCEIASGKGTKEIADQLHISVKTVDSHKSNILSKLRLKTTAELVKYAIKSNLIKL